MTSTLFSLLADQLLRPEIDSDQSTRRLWTDPHIAGQMLGLHLDPDGDAASYRHEVIDRAVDWMYRRFSLDRESRYLDLGCGPGLYTLRLARLGVHAVGIDFSENSLRHARARASESGMEIDYRHESYLETDLAAEFDLITMISCDVSALAPEDRSRLFERVRGWLAPDGVFVFDFHSIPRLLEAREGHYLSHSLEGGFYAEGEYVLIESRFVYEAEQVTCDRYTVVPKKGPPRQLSLWHRYYSLDDMTSMLAHSGMDVIEVYGSVDGTPVTEAASDITVVAKKHPEASDQRASVT